MTVQPSTATELHPAPQWMHDYLSKLIRAVGYQGPVSVVTADPAVFERRIGITDKPHAYTAMNIHKSGCLIVLPKDAEDSPKYRGALRHEFVHVMHAHIDRLAMTTLGDTDLEQYWRLVEDAMNPFVVLLGLVDHFDIQWVPSDQDGEHES